MWSVDNVFVYESQSSAAPLFSNKYDDRIDLYLRGGYYSPKKKLGLYAEVSDGLFSGGEKERNANAMYLSLNGRWTIYTCKWVDVYGVAGFGIPPISLGANFDKIKNKSSLDGCSIRLQLGLNFKTSKRNSHE